MDKEYITPKEAAEAAGVHHHTVLRWIRGGHLPAKQFVPEGPYRISAKHWAEFLEKGLPE